MNALIWTIVILIWCGFALVLFQDYQENKEYVEKMKRLEKEFEERNKD